MCVGDVVVADMLDLPFESESFDLVIEKGTMVCVLQTLMPTSVPTYQYFVLSFFLSYVVLNVNCNSKEQTY